MNSIVSYEDVRSIAYAYNLCVVMCEQIIDYNDMYYLNQVYNEILNNINLENFPKDNALCIALNGLLDTIHNMDEINDEKEAIEQKYQMDKKNAFWSAVPSPSMLLTGGGAATLAANALLTVGTSLMNYKRTMSSIEENNIANNLKLKKQYKAALNCIRVRLFDSAWELCKDHPIPDEYRLSEKDVGRYNEILNDTDERRRYERLERIKDRFCAYPPFWFNLGEAAREVYLKSDSDENRSEYKSKALEAYETFDSIHFVFLKQDVFAASCALSHISLLDIHGDAEKIKILLDKAIKYARDNNDLLQQCIPVALELGDIGKARKLLKELTNEGYSLEINGKLLSLIYNKYDYDKKAYDILVERIGAKNTVPWIDIKPQYRLERFASSMDDPNFVLNYYNGGVEDGSSD